MPTQHIAAIAGTDRTVPGELVDLAVLAIRHGAHRVSLGHQSLGVDFSAPIGWICWITEKDPILHPDPKARSFLLRHQIGDDLEEIQAPAWLTERIDSATEPVTVIDELVELFQAGIRHGWSVKYERGEGEHEIFRKVAEKHGDAAAFGMRHDLTATATNWGYDAAAAARDEHVSTELTLSMREGLERDAIAFSDDGGTHRQVDPSHVESLMRRQAPDFAPVARFNDELEEWML